MSRTDSVSDPLFGEHTSKSSTGSSSTLETAILDTAITSHDQSLKLGTVLDATLQDLLKIYELTITKKREHGGGIYWDGKEFRVRHGIAEADSIILDPWRPGGKNLPDKSFEIVAEFHCHPGKDVAAGRPSGGDIANRKSRKYPWFCLVVTVDKPPVKVPQEEKDGEIVRAYRKDGTTIWVMPLKG